jgi:hypothetical protein
MRFREVFQKIKKFFEINHEWRKKKNIKPRMDPLSRRARGAIRGFCGLSLRRSSAHKLRLKKKSLPTSPSRCSATGVNEEMRISDLGMRNANLVN